MTIPSRKHPCPCGSGKPYGSCCFATDRFAATHPAYDADSDVAKRPPLDLEAYRAKHERAEQYFREIVKGRGPIAQMMMFVQPLLLAVDDDAASIKKAMEIGLMCWNIALNFEPGEQEEREIVETAAQLEFGSSDDPMRFVEVAKWMIARHRQRFPELHAEAKRRRAGLRPTQEVE